MGGRQARRLCPGAAVVPPRMSAYSQASTAVFEIFRDTSPLVEGLSIDEAFIDVRGLERISGTPAAIAARLRRRIREEVGLPITVGVARTKFLAKVASGVAKPDGLLVVPPAAELGFLHPLPVERLWGVGPVTARKLRERGITTVGAGGGASGGRPHRHARARCGPAPARLGPQPRSAAGARRAPPALHRRTARARAVQAALGRARLGAGRAGRPAHATAPIGGSHVPDGRAAVSLRRLRPGDAVAHHAGGDIPDDADPRRRPRAAHGEPVDDPRARRDADRSGADQPRGPRATAARARPSRAGRPQRSTPRSTRCVTGSARRRSRAPCCSAATPAPRCRCCRTRWPAQPLRARRSPRARPTRAARARRRALRGRR